MLFKTGIPRNFQIFKPLDFLAEITQHIPQKGSHQIRFYGHYSNKKRGMKRKKEKAQAEKAVTEKKKACMKWAQLIKLVYEAMHRACRGVDPLICPNCGGTMKIVSFIKEREVIQRILKHCNLWKEPSPVRSRAGPPEKVPKITVSPEFQEPEYEEGVDFIPDYLC